MRRMSLAAAMALFSAVIFAQAIKVTGAQKYNTPGQDWSRGMPTTMYCGNSPESWVRGNATLDPSSGLLSITVQLETDATHAGPKGKIAAALRDSTGKTVATATTEEHGTGGKAPGRAAIRNFSGQTKIPVDVSKRVTAIYLDAQCTGSLSRVFDIKLDTVTDVIKIGVAIAGA